MTLLRRFALPLAVVVVLTPTAYVALGSAGEYVLGSWEAGRLFPFSNAHLREEALEGSYAPLRDPLFVVFSVLVAMCAFAPAMFLGAFRASRPELRFVWLAALVGTGLLAVTVLPELSSQTFAISAAAFFILVASLGAGGVGILLSRLVSPSAKHG